MSRLVTITLLFFVSQSALSQNYGLLGRKNFVEFSFLGNYQVTNLFADNLYSISNRTIPFNYGFKIGLIHSGKKNIAFGLDIYQETQKFYVGDYVNIYSPFSGYTNSYVEIDFKRASGFMIMPKLIFGSRNHNESTPLGFSFDFGLGFASLKSKQAEISLKNDSYSLTQFLTNVVVLDKTNFIYKDLILQFGMHNRFIITDRLMGHFGLNTQLHINLKSDITFTADQFNSSQGIDFNTDLATQTSNYRIDESLRSNRKYRFLNLEFGLAFAL